MSKANILIMTVMAALTISLLALINQPQEEPSWPTKIQGFAFSPYQADQSPLEDVHPSLEQIDADLALLSGKTHAVRTYTVQGNLGEVPNLAKAHKINVAVGAWIDANEEKNAAEIQRLIEVVKGKRNVVRVIVGNESLLREEISVAKLSAYLDQTRKAITPPVSTAEPWHVWLKHPELAEHVDYLAVHMLPFWEGINVEHAVDYVVEKIDRLKQAFPNKPIVIAEVGWPSYGRSRDSAEASEANEAVFLRQFLALAEREKYVYYVMEAFDQPWKAETEGAVGAYWGVYDVERIPKFTFTEPIVRLPEWRTLALIAIALAGVLFALVLVDSRTLLHRGRGFLAIVVYATATATVLIIYDYSQQYLTLGTIIVGILLLIGMIGVIIVLLAEAHEWAEAHWAGMRRRDLQPIQLPDEQLPMVSVHVPAYNEPPEMLIETLNALSLLDYPRFEVLVIDNNTKDPAVWQPVEEYCARLGSRFRFHHVEPLAGFKAGALNYALAHTASEAQIVAVIDSDYTVDPRWLRDLVPQFVKHPRLAIVQAPQDYRDERENAFKAMCHAEYRGFFYIGMITRNERNAIIQHGTMTIVRRCALEEVGGWSEWCITEDAELGLRIFEHGYEASYIPKSYGRGLMPDNFTDFKKQRFRWAYGSVQILRRHAAALLRPGYGNLTAGQRYHFIAGWLPWLADSVNLLFNIAALGWSLAMIYAPQKVDPPLLIFAILPLALFTFKIAKLVYLYRTRVDATVGQTIASAFAGLALSHTIALAMLTGFITRQRPFFRTPKLASSQAWLKALFECREELLFMLAFWLAAYGVITVQTVKNLDLLVWVILLLIQSIPYLAALLVSLVSAFPRLPASFVSRATSTSLDIG